MSFINSLFDARDPLVLFPDVPFKSCNDNVFRLNDFPEMSDGIIHTGYPDVPLDYCPA